MYRVKLITTGQSIAELKNVTSREKLKKYFNHEKVSELISFIDVVSEKVKINKIESICRDHKDDFLLALSKESKADFLITGDKDLLDLRIYGRTEIVTINKFKERVK
jgi:uncharacterized protein